MARTILAFFVGGAVRYLYMLRYQRIFLGLFIFSRGIGYAAQDVLDLPLTTSMIAQSRYAPLWMWAAVSVIVGSALLITFPTRRQPIGRILALLAFAFYLATLITWIEARAMSAVMTTMVVCLGLYVEATSTGHANDP